ncbi:hypothetical protein BCR41DRAFT_401404 [Lobosporangium transversale]|uniref:Uncharacterized protein n=1 Tax=Lobosporangium transversale TaxID=64571 RepID=A0A1Y2G976_9FUNG|nr:hypothetical protein BCR41DRAFT_401404 [Lobosporangium transversale]ORZ01934.1 hypothetical protein BCR41DRAFT_401404 [Lobosporangium transversale]|eukprot:XP_021876187.1 hypothetical protein BCR41DRAFT_401404 [Lobosporangium transversale]
MSIMSLLKNIMYDVEWWVWVILTDLMQKIHMSAGALRIHKPLGPSTQSKSLRLLLKHVKGAKSFAELRTIPEINQTFDTMDMVLLASIDILPAHVATIPTAPAPWNMVPKNTGGKCLAHMASQMRPKEFKPITAAARTVRGFRISTAKRLGKQLFRDRLSLQTFTSFLITHGRFFKALSYASYDKDSTVA